MQEINALQGKEFTGTVRNGEREGENAKVA